MKNVVDNVATQCWEDLLIRPLSDVLTPATVIDMEEAEINKIAKEPAINTDQRESLTRTLKVLELGLETCRRHASFRIPGKWLPDYHQHILYTHSQRKQAKVTAIIQSPTIT
jgi:hypothetical protein